MRFKRNKNKDVYDVLLYEMNRVNRGGEEVRLLDVDPSGEIVDLVSFKLKEYRSIYFLHYEKESHLDIARIYRGGPFYFFVDRIVGRYEFKNAFFSAKKTKETRVQYSTERIHYYTCAANFADLAEVWKERNDWQITGRGTFEKIFKGFIKLMLLDPGDGLRNVHFPDLKNMFMYETD